MDPNIPEQVDVDKVGTTESQLSPEEQADVDAILTNDSTSHGPGDLDNLPESNTNLEVEDD